jgi:hypothetical protein
MTAVRYWGLTLLVVSQACGSGCSLMMRQRRPSTHYPRSVPACEPAPKWAQLGDLLGAGAAFGGMGSVSRSDWPSNRKAVAYVGLAAIATLMISSYIMGDGQSASCEADYREFQRFQAWIRKHKIGEAGGPCNENAECDTGLECDPLQRRVKGVPVGTCVTRTRGAVGAPCYQNDTCDAGLWCDTELHTCFAGTSDGDRGGKCYGNLTCNDGLRCEHTRCVPSVPCTSPTSSEVSPDRSDLKSVP